MTPLPSRDTLSRSTRRARTSRTATALSRDLNAAIGIITAAAAYPLTLNGRPTPCAAGHHQHLESDDFPGYPDDPDAPAEITLACLYGPRWDIDASFGCEDAATIARKVLYDLAGLDDTELVIAATIAPPPTSADAPAIRTDSRRHRPVCDYLDSLRHRSGTRLAILLAAPTLAGEALTAALALERAKQFPSHARPIDSTSLAAAGDRYASRLTGLVTDVIAAAVLTGVDLGRPDWATERTRDYHDTLEIAATCREAGDEATETYLWLATTPAHRHRHPRDLLSLAL